jgi:hypothetical protein
VSRVRKIFNWLDQIAKIHTLEQIKRVTNSTKNKEYLTKKPRNGLKQKMPSNQPSWIAHKNAYQILRYSKSIK